MPVNQDKHKYLCVSSFYEGIGGLQNLRDWLERKLWGLTKSSKILSYIQPGDEMAFYVPNTLQSVVATATIVTGPESATTYGFQGTRVHWIVELESIRWFDKPLRLDTQRRQRMEALRGYRHWAWFLQSGTRILTTHDYEVLTSERL